MPPTGASRNHVTFRTPRFNQTEVKPHFINDACFGEDCAQWLVGELRAHGFPELRDAGQEDWGWQAGGERNGRRFLVSFGLMQEEPREWLVFVTESAPLLGRLLGKAGAPVTPALTQAIHGILTSAPDISAIRWHLEAEFMAGASDGAPAP
jgi:hypothetical protein